jgi:hypothetical protein
MIYDLRFFPPSFRYGAASKFQFLRREEKADYGGNQDNFSDVKSAIRLFLN